MSEDVEPYSSMRDVLRDLAEVAATRPAQMTYISKVQATAAADEIAVLRQLEAACRQEHGGKHDEQECPICEALRELRDADTTGRRSRWLIT